MASSGTLIATPSTKVPSGSSVDTGTPVSLAAFSKSCRTKSFCLSSKFTRTSLATFLAEVTVTVLVNVKVAGLTELIINVVLAALLLVHVEDTETDVEDTLCVFLVDFVLVVGSPVGTDVSHVRVVDLLLELVKESDVAMLLVVVIVLVLLVLMLVALLVFVVVLLVALLPVLVLNVLVFVLVVLELLTVLLVDNVVLELLTLLLVDNVVLELLTLLLVDNVVLELLMVVVVVDVAKIFHRK